MKQKQRLQFVSVANVAVLWFSFSPEEVVAVSVVVVVVGAAVDTEEPESKLKKYTQKIFRQTLTSY